MLHDAHGFWIAEAGSPAALPALEGDVARTSWWSAAATPGCGRRGTCSSADPDARASCSRRALRPRPERAQRRLRLLAVAQPAGAAGRSTASGGGAAGRAARETVRRDRGVVRGAGRRRVVREAASSCVSTAPAQDGAGAGVDGEVMARQDAEQPRAVATRRCSAAAW